MLLFVKKKKKKIRVSTRAAMLLLWQLHKLVAMSTEKLSRSLSPADIRVRHKMHAIVQLLA